MAQTKTTEQREAEQLAAYLQKKGINKRDKNAVMKAVDSFVAEQSPFTSTAVLKRMVSKVIDAEAANGSKPASSSSAYLPGIDYQSAKAILSPTAPSASKDVLKKPANPYLKSDNYVLGVLNKPNTKTQRAAKAPVNPYLQSDNYRLTILNNPKYGFLNAKTIANDGRRPNAGGIAPLAYAAADSGQAGKTTQSSPSANSRKEKMDDFLKQLRKLDIKKIPDSIFEILLKNYKEEAEAKIKMKLSDDVKIARPVIEKYLLDQPVEAKDQTMLVPVPEPTNEPVFESKIVPKQGQTIKAAPEPTEQLVPKPGPTIKAAPDPLEDIVMPTKNPMIKVRIPDSIIETYFINSDYRDAFKKTTGITLPTDKSGIREGIEKYLRDHPEVAEKIVADMGPKLVPKPEGIQNEKLNDLIKDTLGGEYSGDETSIRTTIDKGAKLSDNPMNRYGIPPDSILEYSGISEVERQFYLDAMNNPDPTDRDYINFVYGKYELQEAYERVQMYIDRVFRQNFKEDVNEEKGIESAAGRYVWAPVSSVVNKSFGAVIEFIDALGNVARNRFDGDSREPVPEYRSGARALEEEKEMRELFEKDMGPTGKVVADVGLDIASDLLLSYLGVSWLMPIRDGGIAAYEAGKKEGVTDREQALSALQTAAMSFGSDKVKTILKGVFSSKSNAKAAEKLFSYVAQTVKDVGIDTIFEVAKQKIDNAIMHSDDDFNFSDLLNYNGWKDALSNLIPE